MHDTDIFLTKDDSRLFFSLSHGGVSDFFLSVDMASDDAIFAIMPACLESAEEQCLSISKENQIHRHVHSEFLFLHIISLIHLSCNA